MSIVDYSVVTPYGLVNGYQHFGERYHHIHQQDYKTAWIHNLECHKDAFATVTIVYLKALSQLNTLYS